jgi:hypothetical protein
MENRVIKIEDQKFNSNVDVKKLLIKEDIWEKDLLNYSKEIYQMGNAIMLTSGILMALSFALNNAFNFPVTAVAGVSLLLFVIGFGISLKPIFALVDKTIE